MFYTEAVASLAEAWIETRTWRQMGTRITVASLAEAWIETTTGALDTPSDSCRLPRGGVDRNPHDEEMNPLPEASPPSRRRGSKHRQPGSCNPSYRSPPSRRRGSKHAIEVGRGGEKRGRLPRGGVDRNSGGRSMAWSIRCRLPRGGVDRNFRRVEDRRAWQAVASLAEAWIETVSRMQTASSPWRSSPSRRRGSKHVGRFHGSR